MKLAAIELLRKSHCLPVRVTTYMGYFFFQYWNTTYRVSSVHEASNIIKSAIKYRNEQVWR